MAARSARGVATVSGRLLGTGQPALLRLAEGRIVALAPVDGSGDELPWLAPGLCDLQVNGYAGFDFNQPSLAHETVAGAVRALWREGVTSILPTIITSAAGAIEEGVRAIAAAYARDPLLAASLAGIHLEGPFISPADGPRGAHPAAHVRAPDWALFARWQAAADGLIRLVTLSPEWPEAPDFIARCVASGVRVAIGHTAATPEQIGSAAAAGASLSTHFGNGAHPTLPRHPNYLWAQLADDALWASMIADGAHLPLDVLKVVLRVKGDRAFLVGDTVALAGLPAGRYRTPVGDDVILTIEGRLHLAADPRLMAGSVCPLRGAVERLVRGGLADLATAWALASTGPARFLGLPQGGGIVPGAPADLVLFDHEGGEIAVRETIVRGRRVYCRDRGG